MRAWQTETGTVLLGKPPPLADVLCLPCGKCTGCRISRAKEWALRCHLELIDHRQAAFTTLTYDDRWLPPSLEKPQLQRWLKRFRKRMGPSRPIRFFASGEYGEQNKRPHYHAILFGADETDGMAIQETWSLGHTKTFNVSTATINYVAGYTSKKISDVWETKKGERVDPDTGLVYTWQPPFIQMSRRPGIGGNARQYTQSWRKFAINNGQRQPVPKFLHDAWKQTATEKDIQTLAEEKKQEALTRNTTLQMLAANEIINDSKQALRAAKRTL